MVTHDLAFGGNGKMTGQFQEQKLVIINKTNSISCYKRLLANIRKGHLEHTVVTNSKCEGLKISTYFRVSVQGVKSLGGLLHVYAGGLNFSSNFFLLSFFKKKMEILLHF